MNKVTISGNVTKDIELRMTAGKGTPVATTSIAVNDGYGENKKTYFVNIVVWGKQAEFFANNVLKGQKVVIIDDLLATGGTVEAIIKMVERMQASVVGVAFVIELDDLKGREKFKDIPVCALTHFKGE